MESDATPEQIRAAYRERARRHHPDHAALSGGSDGSAETADAMAALNEAYRVLSDPRRRLDYDRAQQAPAGSAVPPASRTESSWGADDVERPPPPPSPSRLIPAGPARVPWKMMAVMAGVGSVIVLIAAAVTDPPSTEPPDGILRVGSCVEVERNFDVREIACTGEDDIVVELVLPTDATCPVGLGAFRDRLGLGTVCIEVD